MPVLSERALERRLKRHLLKATHSFFAPCAPGFEDSLEAELRSLPDVSLETSERGGIGFSGPLDTVYHANLRLRSAHRVLLRLDSFLAQSYPALFNRVTRLPWEHYLGFNKAYKLRVSAKTSRVRHHKNIIKTVHEGVLKALEPHGLHPVLDDNAALEFHIRLFQDRCTISLNTSGEHLHKRGYRSLVSKAPLRETLAASIALKCESSNYDTVLDPMCGSGTLLIEAALLATNEAPSLNRSFAFEAMPSFQQTKWERFKLEVSNEKRTAHTRFMGNDIDPAVIGSARANATRAKVAQLIRFKQGSAEALEMPLRGDSLLLSNVPYGERLGTQESVKLSLQGFAHHLGHSFKGWHYAFVSKDADWLRSAGLEPKQIFPFKNGGLKVFLVKGQVPY